MSTSVEEGEDFTITVSLDLSGAGVTLNPALMVTVSTNDGSAGRPHRIYTCVHTA